MRYRVVIKDLREAMVPGEPQNAVVVGRTLSQREADQMQKRFMRCKWDARRPGVFTIDHVALCVEVDDETTSP